MSTEGLILTRRSEMFSELSIGLKLAVCDFLVYFWNRARFRKFRLIILSAVPNIRDGILV